MAGKHKVLKQDILIPAGTVFGEAPTKTVRSKDHFDTSVNIGLRDHCGTITFCIDENAPELEEWFEDVVFVTPVDNVLPDHLKRVRAEAQAPAGD